MAKVKSYKSSGLAAWLPDTSMKDIVVWYDCPVHGLRNSDLGLFTCSIAGCNMSIRIGKIKDMTALDKLIYGIKDAGTK